MESITTLLRRFNNKQNKLKKEDTITIIGSDIKFIIDKEDIYLSDILKTMDDKLSKSNLSVFISSILTILTLIYSVSIVNINNTVNNQNQEIKNQNQEIKNQNQEIKNQNQEIKEINKSLNKELTDLKVDIAVLKSKLN